MKRFVLTAVALAAVIVALYYLVYFQGFYIPGAGNETPQADFVTEGTKIYHKQADGTHKELTLKGVELSSFVPGYYATDFAPDESDYLRWLSMIGEMGANTVKVSNIMDDDFYNALYAYNRENASPLYLLQEIPVSDAANYGSQSAAAQGIADSLIEDGKTLVDIIHGRRSLTTGAISGGGNYRKDISRWVLGYVLGSDWNPDFVAYTDHGKGTGYEGSYFSTSADATAFEAVLARVMDAVVAYETDKYGVQRLIGFSNGPETDFLRYDENYAYQLRKYSFLDAQNVLPSPRLKSGYFAAYRLYDYCSDFPDHLEEEQKNSLKSILEGLDRDGVYGGYLTLLSQYHTMPVISSGYGLSSARGANKLGEEPLTEEEQGKRLLEIYDEAVEAGWSGLCISFFQDIWNQSGWNTAFSENASVNQLWGDIQTPAKNYGLMAFEPGEEEAVCTVNGDVSEWQEQDQVYGDGRFTLSAKYDWKGLYLLIQGDFDPETETLYLPLDISGQVGSAVSRSPALSFDRAVDFILCLDGKENSRLLVQDRYLAVRENFAMELEGENPFVSFPEKDSDDFVPVTMAVENDRLLEDYSAMDPSIRRELTAPGVWETGRLSYGNGDPQDPAYDSLADFCYGEGSVEIRLPWLLLNVGDPVSMAAHEDYYENYGVEFEDISAIWMGVTSGDSVSLSPFEVEGTGRHGGYHERLKRSYWIIRQAWEAVS